MSSRLAEATIEEVDEDVARLLNRANSHDGFAAQRGVWFNPPILVQYEAGNAFIRHVNERIAEFPFVFRALSSVPSGARSWTSERARARSAFRSPHWATA